MLLSRIRSSRLPAAVLAVGLSASALGASGATAAGATDVATASAVRPATLGANGKALAAPQAPDVIKAVIAAGNRIAHKPYKWGGGHGRWSDRGYDCSGSVSYALHGGELVDWAFDSTGFMRYGEPGPGRWVTIYANRRHVFMVVAGLRFDTSGADPSRWQEESRELRGFRVRHPAGL